MTKLPTRMQRRILKLLHEELSAEAAWHEHRVGDDSPIQFESFYAGLMVLTKAGWLDFRVGDEGSGMRGRLFKTTDLGWQATVQAKIAPPPVRTTRGAVHNERDLQLLILLQQGRTVGEAADAYLKVTGSTPFGKLHYGPLEKRLFRLHHLGLLLTATPDAPKWATAPKNKLNVAVRTLPSGRVERQKDKCIGRDRRFVCTDAGRLLAERGVARRPSLSQFADRLQRAEVAPKMPPPPREVDPY